LCEPTPKLQLWLSITEILARQAPKFLVTHHHKHRFWLPITRNLATSTPKILVTRHQIQVFGDPSPYFVTENVTKP
jgi:hypothetical protein